MSEQFEMIAKTFQGLEEVLAEELTALGANDVQIGRRMVSFSGDKEMMYKANFCLRTAIRILKPIKHFQAKDADQVYEQIKAIEWENILDPDKTFAIDAVVFSDEFRHSKFVSYKVKDAIVDYFREKFNKRPSVRINNPDISLNIHIAQTTCTLSLDSSGESLHRRGYRQEAVEAPLNEVLAAGMILMTGWRGECDLIDPMSGSGTIPIEAALIARNIAPGVFRKEFAFEKWVDFDQNLLDMIYNDDTQERTFEHKIYAYDNSPKANEIATRNVKAAGVSKDVILKIQPFQQFEQPAEKSVMITNPPYGERISTNDLLGLYQMIGERLKHGFVDNDAWVLSYREECFDQIGLKPSKKMPLFNGALECEFRKYQIFGGRYKDFKSGDGGEENESTDGEGSKERSFSGDREHKPFERKERKEWTPRGDFKPRREEGERSFSGNRDRGFSGDRDRGFSSDRDRGFSGNRDRGFSSDRSRNSSGDRERSSFGDRERGSYGDRDRNDRDRGFSGRKPFERRDQREETPGRESGFRRSDNDRPAYGNRDSFRGNRERSFSEERKSFERSPRNDREFSGNSREFTPNRETEAGQKEHNHETED